MNGKRINEEITGSELCIEFLNCLKLQLKIICIGITYLKKVIRYKEKLVYIITCLNYILDDMFQTR